MKQIVLVLVFFWCAAALQVQAKIVGSNPPVEPLTQARITTLPLAEQQPWSEYLSRSQQRHLADKAAWAAEWKASGATTLTEPEHSYAAHSLPLDREPAWFATAEARQIAVNVVSFQTPAGGWGKNFDLARGPRKPGQWYASLNTSHYLGQGDFDQPADVVWNYIGTIDNDATTTELNYLARVIAAIPAVEGQQLRASYAKGIDYLLEAQYPNGGWPQVWPLEGGYHDAITFNDDAVSEVVEVLRQAAVSTALSQPTRERARKAAERGIACVLKAQIRVNGKRTGWPQQSDPLTLAPASARNFEMPAISAGESASLALLLMDLPAPSADVRAAIEGSVVWFEQTKLMGFAYERTAEGRGLVARSGAGPIWPRFARMGDNLPIFGDRDKTIHDDVRELSLERRNGYGWYGAGPQKALARYAEWKKTEGAGK